MKLSPADKSLLITFSGASFLILIFFFLGVKPFENPNPQEEFIEIPVIEEIEEEPEPKKLATNYRPQSHSPYNSALEQESKALFEEEDAIRKAIEAQQERSVQELMNETELALTESNRKRLEEINQQKEALESKINARERAREERYANAKRESTVSYHLPDRQAIILPNPVYTCDALGKIVLNIKVNSKGAITQMDYNASASTSSNGCLIDQARSYAEKAIFNSSSKLEQLGSITFYFQG